MEEQDTKEQVKIKNLELELEQSKADIKNLELINLKLGYSTMFLAEFHASKSEKLEVCNDIENANNEKEIREYYEKHKKICFNDALDEDSEDFQWSPGFKENIRHYFAVSLGYDIVSEVRDELVIISKYFSLENKIRATPDAALRKPMTDKLLEDREETLVSLDKIINMINAFE